MMDSTLQLATIKPTSGSGWLVGALGMAIGSLSWGLTEQVWPLLLLVLLPICWGLCCSRFQAWVLSLGYFMGAAHGLPAGAIVFFGEGAPQWWGTAMWLGACVLQSVPFALFWSRNAKRRAWGIVGALLMFSLPPLGLIGWVNPVTVTGSLFPGSGWLGLLSCLLLFAFLAMGRWAALIPALLLAVVLNFAAKDFLKAAPEDWASQNTYFSNMWNGGPNLASQRLLAMERTQWLVDVIADLPKGTSLVLPETLLGRWDGVIEGMLANSVRDLKIKGSKVLVGAEISNDHGGYKNALIVLGASKYEPSSAIQSLPVPISMWKPWADDGADADLTGSGNTILVGQQRVAASICYEQLIVMSVLRLMADKPDLLVAVSNVWWATASNIPAIQQQSISAFSRLFNVPALVARNI